MGYLPYEYHGKYPTYPSDPPYIVRRVFHKNVPDFSIDYISNLFELTYFDDNFFMTL